MPKRPSIHYLPEDLQEETLFQTATELIDLVRAPEPFIDINGDIDPVVEKLLTGYVDAEAVQAYHNMFVRPALGTKSALLYVLNLLNIDAKLVEWFEEGLNLPSFKFILDFDTFPEKLNIDRLLDLINAVKNERSHLAVIRQPEDFVDMFILDYTDLDDGILSDVSGYNYRGVNIFLSQKRKRQVKIPATQVKSAMTSLHTQWISHSVADWPLDNFDLGFERRYHNIRFSRSGITERHIIVAPLTVRKIRDYLWDHHFGLDDSHLSGADILPIGSWDFAENVTRDSNYTLVTGSLSDDYLLSELTFERVILPNEIIDYNQQIDFSADPNTVSQMQTTQFTRNPAAKTRETDEQSRSTHTAVQTSSYVIPRFSMGEATGDALRYKVSAYSNHRSEEV